MAFRLSAILLLVLYVTLQFGGRDVDGGPFAEAPAADAESVILAVAPLDDPPPARAVTRAAAPAPVPAAPAAPPATLSDAVAEPDPEAIDPQTALDMAVLDITSSSHTLAAPAALPLSRTLAPGQSPSQTAGFSAAFRAAPAAQGLDASKLAEVTGTEVNLRAGPSTGDQVMGRARAGDQVEWVSSPGPGWALVRHPDYAGELYMASDYLRRVGN